MKRTMAVLLVLCLLTGCSASTGADYSKQKAEEERKSKVSSSLSSSSESSSSESSSSEPLNVKCEIITAEDKSIAGESRFTYRVIVDPSSTEEELIYIANKLAKDDIDRDIVWFYSSQKAVDEGPYDVAMTDKFKTQIPVVTMAVNIPSVDIKSEETIDDKISSAIGDDTFVLVTKEEGAIILNYVVNEKYEDVLTDFSEQFAVVYDITKDSDVNAWTIMYGESPKEALYTMIYDRGEKAVVVADWGKSTKQTFLLNSDYTIDLKSGSTPVYIKSYNENSSSSVASSTPPSSSSKVEPKSSSSSVVSSSVPSSSSSKVEPKSSSVASVPPSGNLVACSSSS